MYRKVERECVDFDIGVLGIFMLTARSEISEKQLPKETRNRKCKYSANSLEADRLVQVEYLRCSVVQELSKA